MPRNITVTFDDGSTHVYQNAPDNVTPEFVTQRASGDFGKSVVSLDGGSQSKKDLGIAPIFQGPVTRTLSNIPSSAVSFGKGIFDAVTSPIQTVKGVADAAAGGLRNITPAPIRNFIDKADSPETTQRLEKTAGAVGDFYKNRYGGLNNISETIQTDPVGFAADLSTVLAAGSGLVKAVPQQSLFAPYAAQAGEALSKASNATNPLNAITKPASGLLKATGSGVSGLLGFATGTSGDVIKQAFQAGKTKNADFIDNLRGDAQMADVVDLTKTGVQKLKDARSKEYASGIAKTAESQKPLDFTPIEQAVNNAVSRNKFDGRKWTVGADEVNSLKELKAIVDEWKADSSLHTPMGLDALKKRVDAIVPPQGQNRAMAANREVAGAIKQQIVKQSPEYADTMKAYSQASDKIDEVQRAFSVGRSATNDTALRKLQSLARNNVQTNYGNRMNLADMLKSEAGVDIMPAISGQALSSFAPRGLAARGASTAGLGAGFFNPAVLPALALTSPRLMGEAAYAAGKASGAISKPGLLSGLSAEEINRALMLLGQSGLIQGEQ